MVHKATRASSRYLPASSPAYQPPGCSSSVVPFLYSGYLLCLQTFLIYARLISSGIYSAISVRPLLITLFKTAHSPIPFLFSPCHSISHYILQDIVFILLHLHTLECNLHEGNYFCMFCYCCIPRIMPDTIGNQRHLCERLNNL